MAANHVHMKKMGWKPTAMHEEYMAELHDFLTTEVTERDRIELELSNASRVMAERRRER
jgi:hypothetical protein